jgi:CBS domain-containing protein
MNADSPVSQAMTTDLITVYPESTLKEVIQIFEENNFHHIPVVDKGKVLVGILSKEDLLSVISKISKDTTGEFYTNLQINTLEVITFMTENPIFIEPDDTIGLAADIVLTNRLHALPVIDDGELVGLVTSFDLLKFALGEIRISE